MQMLRWPEHAALWLLVRAQGLSGERGQTLAEYGLIISIIAVGAVVLGMIAFRNNLVVGWNAMSDCLNGACP